MTTITIKSSETLTRTEFENLAELIAFLTFDNSRLEFSDEFQADINKRSEELKSGKVKSYSLETVQTEIASRISR